MSKYKSGVQGTFLVDNQHLRAILQNKKILAIAPVLQNFANTIQEIKPKRRCCTGTSATDSQQRVQDMYTAARRAMVALPHSVLQKIKDELNTKQLWIPYRDANNRTQTLIT